MLNTEPNYFKEFRKEISKRFDKIEGKLETVEGKLETVIKNQEIHFETIGELKVQVTAIDIKLNKITNRQLTY